jgi:hypothetical protein
MSALNEAEDVAREAWQSAHSPPLRAIAEKARAHFYRELDAAEARGDREGADRAWAAILMAKGSLLALDWLEGNVPGSGGSP